MRSSSLRLTWVFGIALSLAGCSGPPPPAEVTTNSAKPLPDAGDWRIESVDMLRSKSAPNLPVGMEMPPPG